MEVQPLSGLGAGQGWNEGREGAFLGREGKTGAYQAQERAELVEKASTISILPFGAWQPYTELLGLALAT